MCHRFCGTHQVSLGWRGALLFNPGLEPNIPLNHQLIIYDNGFLLISPCFSSGLLMKITNTVPLHLVCTAHLVEACFLALSHPKKGPHCWTLIQFDLSEYKYYPKTHSSEKKIISKLLYLLPISVSYWRAWLHKTWIIWISSVLSEPHFPLIPVVHCFSNFWQCLCVPRSGSVKRGCLTSA